VIGARDFETWGGGVPGDARLSTMGTSRSAGLWDTQAYSRDGPVMLSAAEAAKCSQMPTAAGTCRRGSDSGKCTRSSVGRRDAQEGKP
jgi:hypothetical protein